MLVVVGAAGGVGCTTVAVALAAWSARRRSTLLVDLIGAVPTALGLSPGGPALAAWSATDAPPPSALLDLERAVGPGLSLLATDRPLPVTPVPAAGYGAGRQVALRFELLAALLAADGRAVIVDAGRLDAAPPPVVDAGHPTLVVARGRRRARGGEGPGGAMVGPGPRLDHRADGVVVIDERGRGPGAGRVAHALGVPLVARIPVHGSVVRAAEAGTLARRPPRALRPLRPLVP